MAEVRLFQVDTFTTEPFAGNPAAVCLLEHEPDQEWLQAVAAELRMPATAFVHRRDRSWPLRWFSVTNELEICGHGTLAAAHVLWETGAIAVNAAAEFATAAGPLAAARGDGTIFLTLAAGRVEPANAPPELLRAVGVSIESVWRTPLDYLAVLASPELVARLTPDLAAIASLDLRGVIFTAEGGDGVDFTSRFFAPSVGVPEDSVTGSAHASLAPFWSQRLGRTSLRARQASARGGYLELRVSDETVQIGGPAVTVARGTLAV